MTGRSPAAGVRFALIAMAIFAVQDGVSKHLAAEYPVPFFVMIRYWFFAVFVIALAARAPGGLRGAVRTRLPLTQIFRGLLLVAQILVLVSAFDVIGLAATQAVFAMHPLLTTVAAAALLGESVGWRRLAALGVGFAGVLVILRPGVEAIAPEAVLPLLAAAMFALYAVLTRRVTQADGGSGPAFFYTGIAGAVGLTLIGPLFWVEMALADLGWLGLLCVAGMAGHYCLIRAYDATEAVRLQPLVYLQMVYGMAIGALIFGEQVAWTALLGVGLIIAAGLFVIWREGGLRR